MTSRFVRSDPCGLGNRHQVWASRIVPPVRPKQCATDRPCDAPIVTVRRVETNFSFFETETHLTNMGFCNRQG
jgi:hypothetical protein